MSLTEKDKQAIRAIVHEETRKAVANRPSSAYQRRMSLVNYLQLLGIVGTVAGSVTAVLVGKGNAMKLSDAESKLAQVQTVVTNVVGKVDLITDAL
jgi:hypothetical protein